MAAPILTISGKVLGKSQNLFTSWHRHLPEQPQTLAELLAQIVRSEVQAFGDRQADARSTKVLGIIDIEAGVALGKIISGGGDLDRVVDVDGAIDNALQAFQDGFYHLSMSNNKRTWQRV